MCFADLYQLFTSDLHTSRPKTHFFSSSIHFVEFIAQNKIQTKYWHLKYILQLINVNIFKTKLKFYRKTGFGQIMYSKISLRLSLFRNSDFVRFARWAAMNPAVLFFTFLNSLAILNLCGCTEDIFIDIWNTVRSQAVDELNRKLQERLEEVLQRNLVRKKRYTQSWSSLRGSQHHADGNSFLFWSIFNSFSISIISLQLFIFIQNNLKERQLSWDAMWFKLRFHSWTWHRYSWSRWWLKWHAQVVCRFFWFSWGTLAWPLHRCCYLIIFDRALPLPVDIYFTHDKYLKK